MAARRTDPCPKPERSSTAGGSGGRTRRVEDLETLGVAGELDVADEDVDARDQLERVGEGSPGAGELETVGGRDRVGHGGDDRWVVVHTTPTRTGLLIRR